MNERIKQIRKENKLTQVEFGKRIGVSGSAVTLYEKSARIPSDLVIKSICREFGVYEDWLRYGTGKMTSTDNFDEELASFFGTIQRLKDKDDIRKKMISALSRFTDDDWNKLEAVLDKLKTLLCSNESEQ